MLFSPPWGPVCIILLGNQVRYYKIGQNAQWDGNQQQFEFGLGNFEASLDVIGHEYTHAVVSKVAGTRWSGLLGIGESGALNEAYADIMGSLIEGQSKKIGKKDLGRWEIGEKTQSVIRNLATPSACNDNDSKSPIFPNGFPNHYENRYIGLLHDKGGIHGNSCIFSHAAYRMMMDDGPSNKSYEKDEAWMNQWTQKWAQLFYRSLWRLPSTANFSDAAYAVLNTARTLQFTEKELESIRKAFDDVGIVLNYSFAVT